MSSRDEWVERLNAQLDEDERVAKASTWHEDAGTWKAEPSPYGAGSSPGPRWYIEDSMEDGVISHVDPQASDAEGVARHIALHDPARVLREVHALHRLISAYESFDALGAAAAARLEEGNESARVDWLAATARAGALKDALLALAKARYPDCPEWRP